MLGESVNIGEKLEEEKLKCYNMLCIFFTFVAVIFSKPLDEESCALKLTLFLAVMENIPQVEGNFCDKELRKDDLKT